jgi:hypothetical protein
LERLTHRQEIWVSSILLCEPIYFEPHLRIAMNIDERFPTKLDTIQSAPEPLRKALLESFPAEDSVRFLVHAPLYSTGDERSSATVLVVTSDGWLVVSATEVDGVSVQKSDFRDTLFLELTSILLWGQLKIHFVTAGKPDIAILRFDSVGEELYRDAIDLILDGIEHTLTPSKEVEGDRGSALISESWPVHFRNEAQRYQPKGQRLLAAIQWPAVIGGFRRELSPACALLITEREFVLIKEEKASPRHHAEDLHHFGGIITYIPIAQLSDFHLTQHERFDVLAFQVHAMHGEEELEIIFPVDHEKAVSEVMKQVFAHARDAGI